jgi:ketosteroid isomerase-like protein
VTTEHLELARRAIDAYNGDDIPALLNVISEEVVATIPEQMANAGVYRGHDGFLHMLEDWGEAWEDSASRRASPLPRATAW